MVRQVAQNWEEQGDIRIHTFKYNNVLKSEFYYCFGDKWSEHPFVVIGIDLNSLNIFFRSSTCLYNEQWKRALVDRPSRINYHQKAALRLYNREVNIIRRRLGLPEI